jgi:hypothetical protein
MKTTFKMKEATNKEEAIVSILDVIKENPLWLNKCMDKFCRLIIEIGTTNQRQALLELTPERYVIDLFVELKTEYYNFKDNTQWS